MAILRRMRKDFQPWHVLGQFRGEANQRSLYCTTWPMLSVDGHPCFQGQLLGHATWAITWHSCLEALGLVLCGCHLEILNNVTFECVFYKEQWSMCANRRDICNVCVISCHTILIQPSLCPGSTERQWIHNAIIDSERVQVSVWCWVSGEDGSPKSHISR